MSCHVVCSNLLVVGGVWRVGDERVMLGRGAVGDVRICPRDNNAHARRSAVKSKKVKSSPNKAAQDKSNPHLRSTIPINREAPASAKVSQQVGR